MKFENVVIGMEVQVKRQNHHGFYEENAGKYGVVVDIDGGATFDVQVRYEEGDTEWGNAKGLRKVKDEAHSKDEDQLIGEDQQSNTVEYTQPEIHTDLHFGQTVFINNEEFDYQKAEVRGLEVDGYDGYSAVLVSIVGSSHSVEWVKTYEVYLPKED